MRIDPGFQELYRTEFQQIFRAAFLLCRDRTLAEDVAQEAFARCLERWNRLRDQPWVGGWVMSAALNVARKELKRRGRERSMLGPEPESPRSSDLSLDLRQGIQRLPPRQQEAVLLHYGTDLPVAQVAAVMRCEEGTVKAHLARARESLRAHLGGVVHE